MLKVKEYEGQITGKVTFLKTAQEALRKAMEGRGKQAKVEIVNAEGLGKEDQSEEYAHLLSAEEYAHLAKEAFRVVGEELDGASL